jgi:hypothetical protein
MTQPGALYHALDLASMPVLGRVMREQPLPPNVLEVIKIAAGSAETLERARELTGQRPEAIREAAKLYLQEVLFAPGADHYRVLGVGRTATQKEMRQNMRWLMKWLHPDREKSGWESVFAQRVTVAWDGVKSPERRAVYDRELLRSRPLQQRRRRRRPPRMPWIIEPETKSPSRWARMWSALRSTFGSRERTLPSIDARDGPSM